MAEVTKVVVVEGISVVTSGTDDESNVTGGVSMLTAGTDDSKVTVGVSIDAKEE